MLLFGQALGLDRVDPDGDTYPFGDTDPITREHHDLPYAKLPEPIDDRLGVLAHRIGKPDRAKVLAVLHDMHAGHALDLGLDLVDLGLDLWVEFDEPRSAAHAKLTDRGARPHAPAVDLFVVPRPVRLDLGSKASLEDRCRQRVVGVLLAIDRGPEQVRAGHTLGGRKL